MLRKILQKVGIVELWKMKLIYRMAYKKIINKYTESINELYKAIGIRLVKMFLGGSFLIRFSISAIRMSLIWLRVSARRLTLIPLDSIANAKWFFSELRGTDWDRMYKRMETTYQEAMVYNLCNGDGRSDTPNVTLYDKYANRITTGRPGKYKGRYVMNKYAVNIKAPYPALTLEYALAIENGAFEIQDDTVDAQIKAAIIVDRLYVSCFEFVIWYSLESRKVKKWIKEAYKH